MQSMVIWGTSVMMGGSTSGISLSLSFFSILLMWIFSLSFSIGVAFILPFISSSPVPFNSNPWLVGGLLISPAFLRALTGQHIGYLILQKYISKKMENLSLSHMVKQDWAKLEAKRWLYKSGLLQWLIILIMGHYFEVGSSYFALVWLVSPTFACKCMS